MTDALEWWKIGRKGICNNLVRQVFPQWLRGDFRTEQAGEKVVGERGKRLMSLEISRCRALLDSKPQASNLAPVRLCQGTDPSTGASLPPLLNEEGDDTGAKD